MSRQTQSFLARSGDAVHALCLHLNVQKISIDLSSVQPAALDFPVLYDARMPTHVLILYAPASQQAQRPAPIYVPVDSDLYRQGFRFDLIPRSPPGTTRPVPYSTAHGPYVSIPTVLPLTPIPHPSSLPLLLLFTLGLEQNPNDLAYQMLPVCVVEEFPNAAAMAQVFASAISDAEFEQRFHMNMGLWKNVLGLGVRDSRVVEMVRTAWNVTAEARRLRSRD